MTALEARQLSALLTPPCKECGSTPVYRHGLCGFCFDEFKRQRFNAPVKAFGFGEILTREDIDVPKH